MSTAILGGGAAGFMLALRLKECAPHERVVIFERSRTPLAKVLATGGGRCNVTNTFAHVADAAHVYPRGARLMERLLRAFPPDRLAAWWEAHGVALRVEAEGRVFPATQQSGTVADCLIGEARRLGVELRLGVGAAGVRPEADGSFTVVDHRDAPLPDAHFARAAVTCGGVARAEDLARWAALGHRIETPCPSLFGLRIADERLTALSGITVPQVALALAGTKIRSAGALLVTRRGVSGPAVLRLSAFGARALAESGHRGTLLIGWSGTADTAAAARKLDRTVAAEPRRTLGALRPFGLPARLWQLLLDRADVPAERRAGETGRKTLNRLADLLTADAYAVAGRVAQGDEFVTCGGISLRSVNPGTMESRAVPGLYFAGEVLDIDGVTGGYNLTAAWLTGRAAAEAIARRIDKRA